MMACYTNQQEIPILPQAPAETENTRRGSASKKDGRRGGAARSRRSKRNHDNDEGPLQLVNGKMPLRRRVGWRANEREALRRGLLMFGLGRSEKVRSIMRTLLKLSRHGLGDIADSCWEFVKGCGAYAEPKEREYAEKRLQEASDHGIEMGPEVSERVGEFDKVGRNGSVWLKRLKLLDNLADVVRICANKETREAAYRAIDNLRDASVPHEAWGREADLALLAGVYKHGFGNYESLRKDEQFVEAFSKVFSLPDAEDRNGDTDPQSSSRDKPDWPDANTLTRRLKRLVDHITRVGQQASRAPKASETPHVPRSLKWSKRDKIEFFRQLMRWGLPLAPGKGKVRWQLLIERSTNASLKKRDDSGLEACYRDIFREMKQLLDGPESGQEDGMERSNGKRKRNATSKRASAKAPTFSNLEQSAFSPNVPQDPIGPPVLNEKSAVRLKERLELLDTLRQVPETLQDEDWDTLGLSLHHGHDMPAWWEAGYHDNALVKGVLEYGYGSWDDIFADENLGFPDDIVVRDSEDGAAALAKPSSKACIKRVKFIVNNLRRYLRKLKVQQPPRRKKSTPEVKEPKEVKRFKYARAVEVARDSSSKPILPLILTDRLTLTNLGRIEPDRPGFHTERHIFPIGFTTLREHASMIDPNGRTTYTCTIIDTGGPGPIFRVYPEDDPNLLIERDSASGAWVVVCAQVNQVRGIERDKVTVSGTDMFGLSHPEVCRLIQELPGAELCKNFRPELSFSRFGTQVVTRPTIEDSSLLLDSVLGRSAQLAPDSDVEEADEGGSYRDEIPTSAWHVNTVEPRTGKTLIRPPADQSLEYEEGDEEEEDEENDDNDEDNNEDNNGYGESTDEDD
uniref:ATP-dependent helicase CHD1-2/hrp3 HTH domain-containing protein n=1 Tax=Physcomitrium patens TaxID=3218 RepID=A0A7I4B419_PHYPA